MGNWRQLANDRGLMATLSATIAAEERRNPGVVPDLRAADTVLLVSDYGGAHRGSRVDSYSFLVLAMDDSFRRWEDERRRWRHQFRLGTRHFEFKSLGDRVRGRALDAFLRMATKLNGALLTVLVDKSIRTLFSHERAGRVVHLGSVLVAGVCAPAQNLLWLTDQDDIAPSDDGVRALTTLFGNVASGYLDFDLGHLRCGTTESDDGSLSIEDLAAIPDLAAGATAGLASTWFDRGWSFESAITVSTPQGIPGKSHVLLAWLAARSVGSLGRMIVGMYLGADNRIRVAAIHAECVG
jgi:hypothetical protein